MPGKARKERYKRLLGKVWPRVTMMRDKGAKSSPPWCWWLEDDGFNQEKYETETYIPVSALLSDEVVEAVARSLRPRPFEKTTGLGHQQFAEEDAEDRQAARDDARRHLTAAIEQVGGGQGEGR